MFYSTSVLHLLFVNYLVRLFFVTFIICGSMFDGLFLSFEMAFSVNLCLLLFLNIVSLFMHIYTLFTEMREK